MTFEEFVDTQIAALSRFARVLCCDRVLAEDVVQEVLCRVQPRWARIGALDLPQAYVRRMIVNEYLSWRRRQRTVVMAEVPEAPVEAQRDHADSYVEQQQILGELAKLPARQRTVLVLRYYCGLTDAEISQELGCGPSTVRSHMSRGLAALRIELVSEQRSEWSDRAH